MKLYDSWARPPRMLEELYDLIRFRDLLAQLIVNNLKSRYKRSLIGVAWTLLNPLITMAVTTVAFAHVFRSTIADYPVYVLSGLIVWTFFSQSTTVAMHTMVYTGGHLLKRVYLPRTIFPVAAVGHGVVNLLLGLVALGTIALILGLRPTLALLFLPVSIVVTLAFVLGAALAMATLAVFFVDVIEIFQAAMMAMFYITPVLYPSSIIPQRFSFLVTLNPVAYLLTLFRDPIHQGRLPPAHAIVVSVAAAGAMLVAGWWLFTWKADEIVVRA